MTHELTVMVFTSRDALTAALDRMAHLDYVDIRRAAVVAKAAGGETVVVDGDITPDQAGIAGGTLAAAMGALGVAQLGALALPGVGVIIALGAGALVFGLLGRATGRLAASVVDTSVAKDVIDQLTPRLQAGHPALILELKQRDAVLARLQQDITPHTFDVIPLKAPARTS